MIPLNILSAIRYIATIPYLSVTYRGSYSSVLGAAATTHTFAGVDIGPASPRRSVLVVAQSRGGSSNRQVTALTVAGNAAVRDVLGASSWFPSSLFRRYNPSGTTADIVMTTSASSVAAIIHVYTIDDSASFVSGSGPTAGTDPSATLSVTTPKGAVIAGLSRAAVDPSWTGVEEDGVIEVAPYFYASASGHTEGVPLTIDTVSGQASIVAASYEPAEENVLFYDDFNCGVEHGLGTHMAANHIKVGGQLPSGGGHAVSGTTGTLYTSSNGYNLEDWLVDGAPDVRIQSRLKNLPSILDASRAIGFNIRSGAGSDSISGVAITFTQDTIWVFDLATSSTIETTKTFSPVDSTSFEVDLVLVGDDLSVSVDGAFIHTFLIPTEYQTGTKVGVYTRRGTYDGTIGYDYVRIEEV